MHRENGHVEMLKKQLPWKKTNPGCSGCRITPAVNVAPNVTFIVTDCLLASFKKHTKLPGIVVQLAHVLRMYIGDWHLVKVHLRNHIIGLLWEVQIVAILWCHHALLCFCAMHWILSCALYQLLHCACSLYVHCAGYIVQWRIGMIGLSFPKFVNTSSI